MTYNGPRRQLVSFVRQHDGARIVAALQVPWPEHSLQVIGDGLAEAVRDDVDGARPLALSCADALLERRWTGDSMLADALDAAIKGVEQLFIGEPLRPLAVDLETIGHVLEGDPLEAGGWLDLRTGEARAGCLFRSRRGLRQR